MSSEPAPSGRPLAQRLAKIKPSATLRITAEAKRLKAQGVDLVSLAAGEPDFDTPAHVQEAAIDAMRSGKTRYTPTAGVPELLDAVAGKLRDENGLSYAPEQVIVGAGAKNILYTAAQVLIDPKDEVIVCAPFWVSYPDQVFLNEGRPVIIRTREADNFVLHPDVLNKTVGRNTKAIILNSPSNPTGAGYSRADLEAVAEIAVARDLWIITDEIYERIVFDGFEHVSIASLSPDVSARTIVVNGFSKTYAMTGWRLGYAAGPPEVIRAMNIVQSQNVSNAPSIAQWAGVAALTGDQACVREMVAAFQERKDYIVARLNAMKGVWCFEPRGAFYAFPRIAHYFGMTPAGGGDEIQSSLDLAAYLLDRAKVSVIPGGAFGGDEYLRLSFATGMDQIEKGLDRIESALGALTPGPHYEKLQEHLEQKRF
jgi:aspartate aminotransferase